ncbi:MAG: hypothetical protein IJ776_00385 [Paludibacteraceae bacterium]|nr:hypothetical protein [Paludibacteraceae bacterium]
MKRALGTLLILLLSVAAIAENDPFAAEPEETTSIGIHASSATVDNMSAGFYDVDLFAADGSMLCLRIVSGCKQLPTGEFFFADSESSLSEYAAASSGALHTSDIDWNSRSYLRTAKGNYYFLLKGKVTISSNDGNHKITVEATSAHGSTVTADYQGILDPSAYIDEPQQKSDIEETGVSLRYRPFGTSLTDIFIYTESGSALILDIYSQDVFPLGTFTINDSHEKNSILASVGTHQPSFYQTTGSYWYLTSGKVTIGKNADNWVFDVDAYTHYGSHIKVHYEGWAEYIGTFTPMPDFTYDAEPSEPSALKYSFTNCQYKWYNGILAIDMGDDTTQLYIEMVTAEQEPPAGIYHITTDSVPGTLIASPGGTDQADYGTFLALFDKNENWLCSYYIVSGTLSVKRENSTLTMLFTGRSKKGSDITVTYTGPVNTSIPQTTGSYSQPADDKTYNILGQQVNQNFKGITIRNGRKTLLR